MTVAFRGCPIRPQEDGFTSTAVHQGWNDGTFWRCGSCPSRTLQRAGYNRICRWRLLFAFPSGSRLSLQQRLIYAVVPVNLGNKLKSISSLLDEKHENVDKLQPISLLHALLDKLQYLHRKLPHFASHDTSGNNILHMAGKLAPSNQLNLVSGATLQVQLKLQWFKEVEKFIHPTLKEDQNSEGKTPAMVFTEAHKDLIKEGEKWVKTAANSCTFVSALIATVGFAAAITVPGGNQNDGFPVFFEKNAFRVFSISDGMSLISSIASVLTFLSILTSRYAEADFLVSLPRRLFVGLVTLFLSITSLTVAFGAAIYLVFGHEDDNIIAPLIVLVSLPVWMFGAGHFPLLVDMFLSSMGRSIFCKQSARILF